jgi:hypothetical protein
VLDIFWDNYEMMGVSLVDMKVWEWLYDNPDADARRLKAAVDPHRQGGLERVLRRRLRRAGRAAAGHLLAHDPVPLYLMNYPYGRLIMFQLEDHMAEEDFAEETRRIFSIGRVTPRLWMQRAVGAQIGNQPIFGAVEKALAALE